MRVIVPVVSLAFLGSLSACATIFTGTSQQIAVDSNP